MKAKVIAFYLPQYHPTPDNDKWWGKGFTEWTNVGKAKPLFRGHYQPHVPADLGYYDLRLPEVRVAQAEMARQAGVYGFCYYHYWFGNGKEELELPFDEVVKSGQPDFPFCLCWANESWHAKFWNLDGEVARKTTLVEQTYPGKEDHIRHFYRLLPAFKDPRYIRVNEKPVFMIYRPFDFPLINDFIELWNNLANKNGLSGFHFVAQLSENLTIETINKVFSLGFDAINTVGLWSARRAVASLLERLRARINALVLRLPHARNYSDMYPKFISEVDSMESVYPTIIPNWDHTPRSGSRGYVLLGSTPDLFKKHVKEVMSVVRRKEDQIVFLKSWNEWGEGNYMEPDLKFGKGYIEALKEILDKG